MSAKTGTASDLNAAFRDVLIEAVRDKFGIDVENTWGMFSDRLVTTRVDGRDFTRAQLTFIETFSDGYTAAMVKLLHGEGS